MLWQFELFYGLHWVGCTRGRKFSPRKKTIKAPMPPPSIVQSFTSNWERLTSQTITLVLDNSPFKKGINTYLVRAENGMSFKENTALHRQKHFNWHASRCQKNKKLILLKSVRELILTHLLPLLRSNKESHGKPATQPGLEKSFSISRMEYNQGVKTKKSRNYPQGELS